jgi:hypothetical protein
LRIELRVFFQIGWFRFSDPRHGFKKLTLVEIIFYFKKMSFVILFQLGYSNLMNRATSLAG